MYGPVKAGDPVRVSVDVRNAGARDGAEVVQLYVSRPGTDAPLRSLEGFQRVFLKTGETRRVSFAIDAEALSIVDDDGNRVVEPGAADIWIGGGQPVADGSTSRASGKALQLKIVGRKQVAPF